MLGVGADGSAGGAAHSHRRRPPVADPNPLALRFYLADLERAALPRAGRAIRPARLADPAAVRRLAARIVMRIAAGLGRRPQPGGLAVTD